MARFNLFAILLFLGAAGSAPADELPRTVPVPEVNAPPAGNIAPTHLGDTPVPEIRPAAAGGEGGRAAPQGDEPAGNITPATPGEPPLPESRPDAKAPDRNPVPVGEEPAAAPSSDKTTSDTDVTTPATAPIPEREPQDEDQGGGPPKMLPDPRSGRVASIPMPASEAECRQSLKALGVDYEDKPAESSEIGCSLPYPVSVKSFSKVMSVSPAALLDCEMAETTARFLADHVAPVAKAEFNADLVGITHASAYVCRPRNGTTKLSEHAFGNALDIASFKLSDGRTVNVTGQTDEASLRFLNRVRNEACGPFKTVLGPGSNADHALHFHFDLAPRRNGTTVCE